MEELNKDENLKYFIHDYIFSSRIADVYGLSKTDYDLFIHRLKEKITEEIIFYKTMFWSEIYQK